MSSFLDFTSVSLHVTSVAVQHGPKGLSSAKNLTQLAENNGFENASLAERGTKVKDMRTVAHGSLEIQFATSRGGTSETLYITTPPLADCIN